MSQVVNRVWSPEVREIGDRIAALTLAGAAELSEYLREVHRIEPPGGVGIVPPPPPPPPQPAPPTEWAVRLDGFDPVKKINVIKTVREVTGVGLKAAVDLVETAPRVIRDHLPAAEAEALKKRLEEAGARVSLLPAAADKPLVVSARP